MALTKVTTGIIADSAVTTTQIADAKPTESELTNALAAQQTSFDNAAYSRAREVAYPSIGDQLDMLWHAVDTGDWTAAKVKTTEFYTALKAVKDANPK